MARSLAFSNRLPTASRCAWPCSLSCWPPDRKPAKPKDLPMLLIKNGRIIDPASGTDAQRDIWIDGNRISRVAPAEAPGGSPASPNGQTLDAAGLLIAPGFI